MVRLFGDKCIRMENIKRLFWGRKLWNEWLGRNEYITNTLKRKVMIWQVNVNLIRMGFAEFMYLHKSLSPLTFIVVYTVHESNQEKLGNPWQIMLYCYTALLYYCLCYFMLLRTIFRRIYFQRGIFHVNVWKGD